MNSNFVKFFKNKFSKMKNLLFFLTTLPLFISCNSNTTTEENNQTVVSTPGIDLNEESTLPIDKIKLPEGFKIEVYANDVLNARSMALSPKGTLFVGTRRKGEGKVHAVKDTNNNNKADKIFTLAKGLNMPNGVAVKNGDLYVAEVSTIHKFADIENNLDEPKSEVIYDKYPTDSHHGWKYIAFGPDGKLYIPVGAPCNICESEKRVYNTITRINEDGTGYEIVQEGVRNTVGFNWHPDTKELWFTDNGRDMMGDDIPACEVNRAEKDGMHFGYPYCHQGDLPDPEFGEKRSCDEFVAPAKNLGAHVAPLGIEFIPAGNFPKEYEKQILVAEHGSWNRTEKSGYRVMLLKLDGNKVVSYEPFAEGWLQGQEDWGRPVDMEFMKDGSLLVSDDKANAVYRIFYAG